MMDALLARIHGAMAVQMQLAIQGPYWLFTNAT